MVVSSNLGTVSCASVEEYQMHIKKCMEGISENEIWCSQNGEAEEYPCLAILVKGKQASVHYFAEDNKAIFVSVGDELKDGTVSFMNGQYEVPEYQLVLSEQAFQCALDFFASQKRPECIKWEEL